MFNWNKPINAFKTFLTGPGGKAALGGALLGGASGLLSGAIYGAADDDTSALGGALRGMLTGAAIAGVGGAILGSKFGPSAVRTFLEQRQ